MTSEAAERHARLCWNKPGPVTPESIASAIDRAIAEERQECTKVAGMMYSDSEFVNQSAWRLACTYIVDAIRARGRRLDRERAAVYPTGDIDG